ncbi:MAG: hypothetical protein R8G66_04525 [Cytophagales bacterium]|nr:hypothetical protein [Cytophagales bacterium]
MSKQILIGEAGGSGTQWRLSKGDSKVDQFVTVGYNPQNNAIDDLLHELQQQLTDTQIIDHLYFYAAGLITVDHFLDTRHAFQRLFPQAQVEVQNDALAAARGLCGKSAGWIGFLGTGSGMVYYDGKAISKQIDSLGFILGDEGSGAYLGKILTRDYYRGQMPEGLAKALKPHFEDLGTELGKIYRTKQGNAHLARLAALIAPHLTHPYVDQLIRNAFRAFFDAFAPGDISSPIQFTGSIAFHFNGILREVAIEKHLSIGRIVQSPIAGLLLYHEVR